MVGGLDCDDYDDAVYPSAAEVCDGQYNDCSNNYVETSAPADELMTMAMVGLSVYVTLTSCGMLLMALKNPTPWGMVQMVRLWARLIVFVQMHLVQRTVWTRQGYLVWYQLVNVSVKSLMK